MTQNKKIKQLRAEIASHNEDIHRLKKAIESMVGHGAKEARERADNTIKSKISQINALKRRFATITGRPYGS